MGAMGEEHAERALEAFESFLRPKRLRMTSQRRRMVRAALAQQGHFTAEELHARLRREDEDVSLATVYRGLALLAEAGILEAHDFADGQLRYERMLEREHHDHMVCLDCRAVIEFQECRIEALQEEIVRRHDMEIQDHSLTIFVTCNAWRRGRCARREERERRRGRRREA
jgi:Fur family ferric uptake transcriptional regulator